MFGLKIALLLNATIIFPSVIGFIRFRSLPICYKFIAILFIIAMLNDGWMNVFSFYKKNNLLGVHFYVNVEIILLSLFFIYQLKRSIEKKITWIAFIGLSTFSITYSIMGNTQQFNSLPWALETIFFSTLSCYMFYKKAVDPQPDENDSFYFVNGTILFYFSSNFLVFAFSNHFIKDQENLLVMFNVHAIVHAISNIVYAVGLWKASKSSYSVA